MTTAEVFAPAKINLTLHVTGQRDDGYHLLNSLVVFADIGDQVRLSPSEKTTLEITGPRANGVPENAKNLAWRALNSTGYTANISVEKNLPSAAGIGGGSADAAAVLRAVDAIWGTRPSAQTLVKLGADVPMCLNSSAQIVDGIGEVLTPVSLPQISALLVNPGVTVPTGAVFERLASKDNEPMTEPPVTRTPSEILAWVAQGRNDLEPAAGALAPEIDQVIGELENCAGCQLARMSGSGATCFGLFSDDVSAIAARGRLRESHPHWWIKSVRLGDQSARAQAILATT